MVVVKKTVTGFSALYRWVISAGLVLFGFVSILFLSGESKPSVGDTVGVGVAHADAPYAQSYYQGYYQGAYGDSGSASGDSGSAGSACDAGDSGGGCGY